MENTDKMIFTGVRVSSDTLLELKARKINVSLLVRDLLRAYLREDNRDIDNMRKDLKALQEDKESISAKMAALVAKIKKREALEEKWRKEQALKMNNTTIDEDVAVRYAR